MVTNKNHTNNIMINNQLSNNTVITTRLFHKKSWHLFVGRWPTKFLFVLTQRQPKNPYLKKPTPSLFLASRKPTRKDSPNSSLAESVTCITGRTSWWFHPIWKYLSKWESPPNKGEHKKIFGNGKIIFNSSKSGGFGMLGWWKSFPVRPAQVWSG